MEDFSDEEQRQFEIENQTLGEKVLIEILENLRIIRKLLEDNKIQKST